LDSKTENKIGKRRKKKKTEIKKEKKKEANCSAQLICSHSTQPRIASQPTHYSLAFFPFPSVYDARAPPRQLHLLPLLSQ
jgi:hypothetical protein